MRFSVFLTTPPVPVIKDQCIPLIIPVFNTGVHKLLADTRKDKEPGHNFLKILSYQNRYSLWLISPQCCIYASVNWVSTGSGNGLVLNRRRQVIAWTNDDLLPIGPLGTNLSENWIEILTFSFRKMRLKMSSVKWQPFCPGGDELR